MSCQPILGKVNFHQIEALFCHIEDLLLPIVDMFCQKEDLFRHIEDVLYPKEDVLHYIEDVLHPIEACSDFRRLILRDANDLRYGK